MRIAFPPTLASSVDMDQRRTSGPCRQQTGLLRCTALGSGVLLLASAAAVAAPATYDVQVQTRSGMGSGASGMEMMQILMGSGQPQATRSLDLTLTSAQGAPAAPQAEHLIPAALGLGNSLPLLTPPPGKESADDEPGELKGRLVIFRGCAGSATADKPVEIDLASLMPDQRRLAQAMASGKGWSSQEPRQAATKGTWPNRQSDKKVPGNASLVGEHRVLSNYAPEIRFQVGRAHDFLAPVQLTTRSASEAMELSWQPVPTALGSQAMAIGGKESGKELLLWTSSTAAWGESSVPSALDAATARKLINKGVLMPPEQTRCTIGAAVMKRLGEGVVLLTAYGEALRAAGPAPAPGRPPLWTMTLVRDSVSTMPLMDMDGSQGSESGEPPRQEEPKKRGGWGLIPGFF